MEGRRPVSKTKKTWNKVVEEDSWKMKKRQKTTQMGQHNWDHRGTHVRCRPVDKTNKSKSYKNIK